MIYCPQCGTPNKPNSKFCKNCAALLSPSTDVRCPICGTMNPQGAASCSSCGTRLNPTATTSADKTTPADTPEHITPYSPPEPSPENEQDEQNGTADNSPEAYSRGAAAARPTFTTSSSEWLRRVQKTPPPEPPAPTTSQAAPIAEPPASEPSARVAPPPLGQPLPPDDDSEGDIPEWLREIQAEANRQAAQESAQDNAAAAAGIVAASQVVKSTSEVDTKSELADIKLTGDDYDYSDVPGQVTDEMKAQLEAAPNAESVEDEVALARRLLGLEVAEQVITSDPPASAAPISETPAAPTTPVEPFVTQAPAQEAAIPVVPIAAAAALASEAADATAASETSAAPEALAQSETAPTPSPVLSDIKLTGDDYDYSDVPGQVTDEMKAQLETEGAQAESVEDEVALARRLLGLAAAEEIVSNVEPTASQASSSEPLAPSPASADTPTAQAEPAPTAASSAPNIKPDEEEDAEPEWLTALAAASAAALVKNAHQDREQAQAQPEPAAAPLVPTETTPAAAEAVAQVSEPAAETPDILPAAAAAAATAAVLAHDDKDTADSRTPEQAQLVESESTLTTESSPVTDAGKMPDWLREIAPEDVQAAQAEAADLDAGEPPQWVRKMAPIATVAGASALLSHVPDLDEQEREDLPDWLREPVEPEPAAPVAEDETLGDPLAIPAWFADSAAGKPTREPFEAVETTGPLAGITGILPLAVAIAEPHTLTTPTPVKSDGGRIFQTLVAEPLASDARTDESTPTRRLLTANHLLYLLILLAATIPLFFALDQAGLGLNATQSATAGFYDQLQSVPANGTVLMAFDYSPGQGVEMDPAARAILQDLIARKANVIALSSNPNGATIAQNMLLHAQELDPSFTFVNLGYIPGNEAGLRALASGWLPANYGVANGVPWGATPLAATIHGMDDLALSVLLVGDDPSLRVWMEQVEPRVTSPMVAATTAAVEPQARNYVNANQLQASLRGLVGAAELELLENRTGQSVKTVDALSVTSLLLAGIVVAGNVAWFMRRGKKA